MREPAWTFTCPLTSLISIRSSTHTRFTKRSLRKSLLRTTNPRPALSLALPARTRRSTLLCPLLTLAPTMATSITCSKTRRTTHKSLTPSAPLASSSTSRRCTLATMSLQSIPTISTSLTICRCTQATSLTTSKMCIATSLCHTWE